jgi:tetratricopeptide (TPR) repeat protein
MPSGTKRSSRSGSAWLALGLIALLSGCATTLGRHNTPPFVLASGERLEGKPVVRPALIVGGERIEAMTGAAYQRGKAHLMIGQFGLAIQALKEALAAEPRSVPVLNALAIAYGRIGRDDLSLRYFERALAADPDSAETFNNVGYWALERGQLDLARRYLEQASRRTPANPRIAANLALLARSAPPNMMSPSPPRRLFPSERIEPGLQRLRTVPVAPA